MQLQLNNSMKKLFTVSGVLLLSNACVAQETNANTGASGNMLAALMITVAVILAFVIWGMGNVLVTLGKEALRRAKSNNAKAITGLLILSLMSVPGFAQENVAEAAVATTSSFNYGGLSATLFWVLVMVIFIEMVSIFFLLFMIKRIQQELVPEEQRVKEHTVKEWWSKIDKRFFTKAVPVEKEKDIMLDHDFDGIRELDNSLPPWWKYGFLITIVSSVVYLFYFHVGNGPNPEQEYQREMELAALAIAKYNANSTEKIDENNLVISDATGIENGKKIYNMACWACHGKEGEGGTGPNLTDDYWLHKGGLGDVYHSIKVGYPDKGMQSWEKVYSPKEILNLASYIKTLKGTNPAGAKAPQGDIWVEDAAPVEATELPDSSKTVIADSTAVAIAKI